MTPSPSPSLRYYYSLAKLLLVFAVSCAFFTAACLYLLPDAQSSSDGLNQLMLYVAMGFFGLCAVGSLAFATLRVVRPRPWLVLDERGVTYYAGVLSRTPGHTRTILWKDIRDIAIYRLRLRAGKVTSTQYLLTFSSQAPHIGAGGTPDGGPQAFSAALLGYEGIAIPLKMYFLACTRARRAALLHDIKTNFAPQLARYGICLDEHQRER